MATDIRTPSERSQMEQNDTRALLWAVAALLIIGILTYTASTAYYRSDRAAQPTAATPANQ